MGIVRRPDPAPYPSCALGEWSMCSNVGYSAHGIEQVDGFMAERRRIERDHAVRVDRGLGVLAVLLEPTTAVAKAWEQIISALPAPSGVVIMARAYRDSSRSAQRKLVRRALVRPTLSGAALFVLYFSLPLDNRFGTRTVVVLFVGIGALAGLVALQVRTIVRSPHPRLTAITALAFSIPLFVLLFATTYYLMEQTASSAFSQPMTRLDALYFTVTVLTTVGFGDIAPHSELARALTTSQMVGDLLLIGLVVRVLLGAVQTGLAGRAGQGKSNRPEPSEPEA